MTAPPWQPPEPRWRAAPAAPGSVPSRRRLVLALLAAAAALVAGVALALPYLRPPTRCRLVSLCAADHRDRELPPPPWRAQDHQALAGGGYFTPHGDAPTTSLGGRDLMRELESLSRGATTPTVVHLTAYARTDAQGRAWLLPSDADLDDPTTWVLFRDVLARLREARARRLLLLLDLLPAKVSPRRGWVLDDVMACVPGDLDAVPDDRRLVLCSHSAGERPLASEVLGRSAFGHYVEEGLRGWADSSGDGRVTARELGEFVRARVARWARRSRQAQQSPALLGAGKDFPLVDLPNGRPQAHAETPDDRAYPAALAGAWKKAAGPREKLALLRAEQDWRAGAEPGSWAVPPAPAAQAPPPRSLALAAAGREVPRATVDALRRAAYLAEARTRGLAADKAGPVRVKLVDDLVKSQKDTPPALLARAALDLAIADARPERLPFLSEVVRAVEPEPEHVETLLLARLAGLGLPTPVLTRALEAVRDGEQAVAQPAVFPWVAGELEATARERHEALVLLTARGFAPLAVADRALEQVARRLASLLAVQRSAHDALAARDDARALLPETLAALDSSGAPDAPWLRAATLAAELGERLESARGGKLIAVVDALREGTAALRARLDEMSAAYTPEALGALTHSSRRGNASAATYRQLDGALATTRIDGATRPAVWQAAVQLARRLEEEVLRLDRADATRAGEPPAGAEAAPTLVRQARLAVALAGVAGASADARQRMLHQFEGDPSRQALAGVEADLAAAWRAVPPAADDRGLWAWLADWYRYLAREQAALAPGGAEVAFYRRAADEYRSYLLHPGESAIDIDEASDPGRLLPARPITTTVQVRAVTTAAQPSPIRLRLLAPDEEWLSYSPAEADLKPPLKQAADGRWIVPVTVALRPEAGRGAAAPPLGLLAQARSVGGRAYHRPLPVPLTARTPQLLLSADEKAPGPGLPDLRLRAVPGRQAFFLHVTNPIDRAYSALVVRMAAGGGTYETAPFALPPRGTHLARFLPAAPPPGAAPAPAGAAGAPAALPDLTGPLVLQVIDRDGGRAEALTTREVPVGLARPDEYVSITAVRFDPAGGRNRLTVRARLKRPVAGPPVAVALSLPPLDEGGGTHATGTLVGKLPADGQEVTLFAEGVRGNPLVPALPVRFHVGVDGWARAFVFQATLGGAGAVTPDQVVQPLLRPRAGPSALAGPRFAVPVEADNAPAGSRLVVEVGRLAGGQFRQEAVARRATPRQERVGFAVSKAGGIELEASLSDWVVTVDTTGTRGPREVRARLVDREGSTVLVAPRAVLFSDEAPAGARFLNPPARAWAKAPLALRATASDALAGIKEVNFFIGRPAGGKAPEAAKKVPGVADPSGQVWSARLPPPGAAGEADVSVEFVNGVGLRAFDTVTVALTEEDPARTAPGTISGQVSEGDRPQAGLSVVLTDEKGAERATATTRADGAYQFKDVAPGKYRLKVTKPSNQRKGSYPRAAGAFLELAPGASVSAPIALFIE